MPKAFALCADEVNIMMPRPEYEALLESMMQACQAGYCLEHQPNSDLKAFQHSLRTLPFGMRQFEWPLDAKTTDEIFVSLWVDDWSPKSTSKTAVILMLSSIQQPSSASCTSSS